MRAEREQAKQRMGIKPAAFIMVNVVVGFAAGIAGFYFYDSAIFGKIFGFCLFYGSYFYLNDAEYLERRLIFVALLEIAWIIIFHRYVDDVYLKGRGAWLYYWLASWVSLYLIVRIDNRLTGDRQAAAAEKGE